MWILFGVGVLQWRPYSLIFGSLLHIFFAASYIARYPIHFPFGRGAKKTHAFTWIAFMFIWVEFGVYFCLLVVCLVSLKTHQCAWLSVEYLAVRYTKNHLRPRQFYEKQIVSGWIEYRDYFRLFITLLLAYADCEYIEPSDANRIWVTAYKLLTKYPSKEGEITSTIFLIRDFVESAQQKVGSLWNSYLLGQKFIIYSSISSLFR